jgi:hypothetical protein
MKSWGLTLLFIGVGAFILPALGVQFLVIGAFGGAQYAVAGIAIVLGLVLTVAGWNDDSDD